MLDLSKVDAVLLSDGWHFINVGSFALVSEGTVGHAPSFTFTMPDREGVGGDSVGGTVVGPWYSVRAWRTPTT